MSKFLYSLYCDESGVGQGSVFYLGGIHCSPARAALLERQIKAFRERTGCVREMKWAKVSQKMLPAYTEFVDIFLQDPYATFVLAEMHKNEHWRKLARSEDSRFLQAYFCFLEEAMWATARYRIYLDDTSSKRYKWKSLHYGMNLPNIRWKQQKKVPVLVTVDSRTNDIMQLVDVLLGALTATPTAPHRLALAAHVRTCADSETRSGSPKVRTIIWTVPETRRFRPNI